MKDRILRLCRRLDKFTLDEISTITEDINESVLELLLLTLVQEEKLIFKDNIYLYNKEQGCNKQRLPQFFQHHSKTDMGCMGFGDSKSGQHSWAIDENSTREIIKYGFEKGINFYDTALVYQQGTSEQYVGKALRDFSNREDYVIATKFTPRTQDEIDNNITGQKHIENYLNQSLKNLELDYVDLYIYHIVLMSAVIIKSSSRAVSILIFTLFSKTSAIVWLLSFGQG